MSAVIDLDGFPHTLIKLLSLQLCKIMSFCTSNYTLVAYFKLKHMQRMKCLKLNANQLMLTTIDHKCTARSCGLHNGYIMSGKLCMMRCRTFKLVINMIAKWWSTIWFVRVAIHFLLSSFTLTASCNLRA